MLSVAARQWLARISSVTLSTGSVLGRSVIAGFLLVSRPQLQRKILCLHEGRLPQFGLVRCLPDGVPDNADTILGSKILLAFLIPSCRVRTTLPRGSTSPVKPLGMQLVVSDCAMTAGPSSVCPPRAGSVRRAARCGPHLRGGPRSRAPAWPDRCREVLERRLLDLSPATTSRRFMICTSASSSQKA